MWKINQLDAHQDTQAVSALLGSGITYYIITSVLLFSKSAA